LEDLKQIINECASGNARAQEKLYRMFAPKMFGVCLRYAKDRSEAEDNLHDGFIKVFSNIKSFRHEGSFEGWMRKIMVNVSLGRLREKQVLYTVEDIGEYDTAQDTNNILEQLEANELLKLIEELPPGYRAVFNLYVIEDMSHKEISETLGLSVGTSKSNLARARDILKRKVNELYGKVESKAN
jgi:RNA polymerase sigma-70 factor (ECF subfamily)